MKDTTRFKTVENYVDAKVFHPEDTIIFEQEGKDFPERCTLYTIPERFFEKEVYAFSSRKNGKKNTKVFKLCIK